MTLFDLFTSQRQRIFSITGIAVIAFLLRVFALACYGFSSVHFGDSADYVTAAQQICFEGLYPNAKGLPFFRAPGLPIFLVATTLCHTSSLVTMKLALVAVDILGLFGVVSLLRSFAVDEWRIKTSALLYACSPFLIAQILNIQTESLFQTTLIWTIALMARRSLRDLLLAGGLAGFAALVRPIGLGLIPFELLGLIVFLQRKNFLPYFLFLFGAIIVVMPWTYSNYLRTGEVIVVNDAFGYNFWRGNHPLMQNIYAAKSPSELEALSSVLENKLTPEMTAQLKTDDQTNSSALFFREGLSNISKDPIGWGRLLLNKIWVYFRPWVDVAAWGVLSATVLGFWEILLYVIAFCGWKKLLKISSLLGIYIISYLLLTCVLNLPFQVVARFRIPLVEWVLIALAGIGLKRGKLITYLFPQQSTQ